MSGLLWRYYLEDDVDTFRQVLEEAAVGSRAQGQRSNISGQLGAGNSTYALGSPGANIGSPSASHDVRRTSGMRAYTNTQKISFLDVTLSKADINRRDGKGMTLLHYAASGTQENALGFALALLAHPFVDLYPQDFENGWTALHRAFYFGNITIARAILERECQDAVGQSSSGSVASGAQSLIKIKDREGNGPYDLLSATIKDRTLQHRDPSARHPFLSGRDDEEEEDMDAGTDDSDDNRRRRTAIKPLVDVQGDELLTFGSNRNITLGLGNQDDRQYPERVVLRKPDHLFRRFYREMIEQRAMQTDVACPPLAEIMRSKLRQTGAITELPSVVRFRYDKIQDVQMSKFHTAVLTNDPVSNLYMCGHGLGGRLGTGDQKTQFSLVCIEGFGSSRKNIAAVALGQDHSIAVTDQGEVWSWGNNAFGQLGLGMPKNSLNADDNVEVLPKQIFGPLKREPIVGVAASRIHSVAHTTSALFTWGKNEGQLGIVDAHAGSLEMQAIPRRVAASRFSCAITSVSAIDRATICLLENQEVHVFANYGIVKVVFPLDSYTSSFIKKSFLTTRYDEEPNRIVKITGGGDTFCALSSAGEIFSVSVDQRLDPGSSSTMSTTNPNKIRAALSTPIRIWSLKKGHMTAKDVGVDQDGSIILSTNAGSVWRRVRRPGLPSGRGPSAADRKSKEFKFSRVPGLTRVVAVRASASGAYCAMRSECDVTRTQFQPSGKSLWYDAHALLPFKNLMHEEDSDTENPTPRFWSKKPDPLQRLVACLAASKDLEKDIQGILRSSPNEHSENYNAIVRTTASEVALPVHRFMLASRSRILRQLLAENSRAQPADGDLFTISNDDQGRTILTFQGVDFLTIIELVLYVYTDVFVGFWLRSRHAPQLAYRYRQVRAELMKIASRFELRNLESAARRMSPTAELSLDKDIELAVMDSNFFLDGNAVIELEDGEALIHTDLVTRRCPFFEGLFQGRAGGRWLADRRDMLTSPDEAVGIDLTHVNLSTFQLVLRHIYADSGEELFDDIVTKDLDQFLDIVLEVLSVANELMLDRLSQICQMVIGRYVNARNVCQLLNAVAPSSVSQFKDAGLEYLCLNLESMLSSHLLDELDEDVLHELDIVVRDNQLATLPFAKSGRAEALLHEKYPSLALQLDRARRAKLDSINFQAKFAEPGASFGTSSDFLFGEQPAAASGRSKLRTRPSVSTSSTAPQTPSMMPSSGGVDHFAGERIISHQPSLTTLVEQQDATRGSAPPSSGPSPSGPRPRIGRTPSSQAFGMLPQPVDADMTSNSPGTTPGGAEISTSSTTKSWVASPLPSSKLSMKEIMNQAAVRTSNLSLGLASKNESLETQPPTGSSMRTSQKQRKRQQQVQLDDQPSTPQRPGSTPWQTVGAKAQSSSRNLGGESQAKAAPTPPLAPTLPQRVPSTPQLTLRQTIAHTPTSGKRKESAASPALKVPQTLSTPAHQQRSASTPQALASPRPPLAPSTPSTSSATKSVQIQSVRHTPRSPTINDLASTSPTFFMHNSLADILSQQAAEKLEIKEAVAKRSLAEIQQEQEFLSWWEGESQRIKEEEERATRAAEKGSRGGRPGKGRGGRAVSGGGDGKGASRGGRSVSGGGKGRGGASRGGKERSERAPPPTTSGPAPANAS